MSFDAFQNMMMQQSAAANGQQKPIHAAATVALGVGGVNLADTDHLGHLSTKSVVGTDLANQSMLKLSSKPMEQKQSFTQKIASEMGQKYLESFKNGSQASGSSSGGGGGGASSASSGGTATASSGSSAPVSSGGGGGGGGGAGSGAASRGGSGDADLSRAIASLQGISFSPEQISMPVQQPIDTHIPPPPPPVVAPVAALADDGIGIG